MRHIVEEVSLSCMEKNPLKRYMEKSHAWDYTREEKKAAIGPHQSTCFGLALGREIGQNVNEWAYENGLGLGPPNGPIWTLSIGPSQNKIK